MNSLQEKVSQVVYDMMNEPNSTSPVEIAEEIVPMILNVVEKAIQERLFHMSCTCSFAVEDVFKELRNEKL